MSRYDKVMLSLHLVSTVLWTVVVVYADPPKPPQHPKLIVEPQKLETPDKYLPRVLVSISKVIPDDRYLCFEAVPGIDTNFACVEVGQVRRWITEKFANPPPLTPKIVR